MSDTFVQLPYTATTSGDLLDGELVTVGANAVKRERMQITGAAATAIAPVTSSGGLLVTLSTVPGFITTLSSNPVTGQVVSLSSGLVTLSSNPVAGQVVSLSSGLVTLSSNPVAGQIVSLSSGTVTLSSNPTVLTTGTYLVNATSTSGLLVDPSRGVVLQFFNLTATSSGLKSLVAASGSLKVKLVSYALVSNSTNEIAFYSSNTPIAAASSSPIVLSSHSGIAIAGDRTSWVLETSAAGSLQIYLGNSGIIAGHGAFFYEV